MCWNQQLLISNEYWIILCNFFFFFIPCHPFDTQTCQMIKSTIMVSQWYGRTKKVSKIQSFKYFISCALMTFMLDYMKNEITEYELQPFDRKCTASNLFPQTVAHLAVGTYLDKRHKKNSITFLYEIWTNSNSHNSLLQDDILMLLFFLFVFFIKKCYPHPSQLKTEEKKKEKPNGSLA